MWVSLEAMIKRLSFSTVFLIGADKAECVQAAAQLVFENLKESLLQSVELARRAGTMEEVLLTTLEEVDAFSGKICAYEGG